MELSIDEPTKRWQLSQCYEDFQVNGRLLSVYLTQVLKPDFKAQEVLLKIDESLNLLRCTCDICDFDVEQIDKLLLLIENVINEPVIDKEALCSEVANTLLLIQKYFANLLPGLLEVYDWERAVNCWYATLNPENCTPLDDCLKISCGKAGNKRSLKHLGIHHAVVISRCLTLILNAGEAGWVVWVHDASAFLRSAPGFGLATRRVPELDNYYKAFVISIDSELFQHSEVLVPLTPLIEAVPHNMLNHMIGGILPYHLLVYRQNYIDPDDGIKKKYSLHEG